MTDGLARLGQAFDAAESQRRTLEFWWRDDDLCRPTAASSRLFTFAEETGVALAIAVIPQLADPLLAAELAGTDHQVWQHGYAHKNHAGDVHAGARYSELGDERDASIVLTELAAGQRRLEQLFGERSAPVLVPPFGHIGHSVAARIDEAGYRAVSLHGSAGARVKVPIPLLNTHVDVLDWTLPNRAMPTELLMQQLTEAAVQATQSALARAIPIGVLTHHLDLPDESWTFMREIVCLINEHNGARWIAPQDLIASLPASEIA